MPENQQIQLQSKDVLRVARIPQWYESNNILLQGEVVFPGTYQIKSGETLSNVIQRAGGLTDLANPNAAVFTRKELAVKESRNIDKAVEDLRQQLANNALSNSQYTRSVDYQTANQVLDDLSNTKPVGRMVINFEAILAGSPSADIVLKNGDKLIIPNVTPAVTIIGEVFVSVTYRYDSALSIDDYLQLAGGVKEYGDSSRIYIVRANGAVFVPKQNFWFSGSSDNFLEPGDTIVVPRDVTNYDNIGIWQGVTQIIYQTAVALAAVSTF